MSQPGGTVTVFTGGDIGEVIMAKLLLETEGIRFIAEGEGVQELFGLGRTVGGYNLLTGPVRLRVAAENATRALEVLAEMDDD